MVALATADDGREERDPLGAEIAADAVEDLAPGLRSDRLLALRAVLHAELGEQQPQVVRDLGDGGDRRGASAAREALLDRDRRRQPGEEIDVRLRHDVEELPGVRGQAVDVAALSLGVEHVEGERRLARAGQPREHDQAIARQLEGDVAQVVLARAHHADAAEGRLRRRVPYRLCVGGAGGIVQRVAQEAAGGRGGRRGDALGRALGDHPAARVAAVGAEVDHPVGALHDLEVVLDHEQRVAAVDEAREARQQPLDVREMQPRRGLVEHEERVRAGLAPEVGGELQALRLAAGERRERLPEAQVVEADVGERLQAGADLGLALEQGDGLGDREVEDLADRASLPAHLEHLGLEARPVALGAGHVDVGEELHLDALEAVAGAGLAAAARDVEGERGGGVAAEPRHVGAREARADALVGPEIGRGVGAGRRADLALVDEHDLGDALRALDGAVRARNTVGLAEALAHRAVEHVLDQARLAGPRDAGDRDEAGERDVDVDGLQVVRRGAADAQREPLDRPPPLGRHRDRPAPREEVRGHRAARRPAGRRPGPRRARCRRARRRRVRGRSRGRRHG